VCLAPTAKVFYRSADDPEPVRAKSCLPGWVAPRRKRAAFNLTRKEAARRSPLVHVVALGDRLPAAATTMSQRYTFGDNDRAAARLTLLAQVYEPSTRALLESIGVRPVEAAVDLGCGPGYSTELLHAALGSRETWGIDRSERLVERARARRGPPLQFAVGDVTVAPMPGPRFNVAYGRHLLAHLASPRDVLVACAESARPGAKLILEETASLDSADPLFVGYYARVSALQRHYGQDTFVGARLDRFAADTPWVVERFELTALEIAARSMARLHAENARTWGDDAYARIAFDAREMAAMIEGLDEVAAGVRGAPPVRCGLGQLVLRK